MALAQPPARIVSLSPAVTELLFALGVGDRLVGRTTWCDYPPAAHQIPSVGDGLNPNIEAVAARHPDLVVLYRSALNETAAAQLARLGIPAVVVQQDRLEDIARAARRLGHLTGTDRAGDSLASALEQLVAGSGLPRRPRARVAFVVWDNPPVVIGAGSYLDELAGLVGAANVFHDIAAASATVGLETIVSRDPDLIVVLRDSATAEPPGFLRRPEWRAVRAVRQARIVYLTGSLFARPGPRAAEAVAEFRRYLEEATP
ncbi:MAG TPA: helical backbone metal receptor [Candidatus Dormibacteraeota bacterium]|nr:helical backbone metal receptor [Candidatus Dormibacteraeota bacterium]